VKRKREGNFPLSLLPLKVPYKPEFSLDFFFQKKNISIRVNPNFLKFPHISFSKMEVR